MSSGGVDRVSLVGGIAVVLLGALLCLDQLELVSLSAGLAAAAICAAAGSALVASGLLPTGTGPMADTAANAAPGPWRRDLGEGVVAGVIAGLATELGLDANLARVLFAVGVILTGGLLLGAYVIAWAFLPSLDADGRLAPARASAGPGRRGLHLGLGVGLLTLAALLVFRELGIWWSDALVWPLVLAAAGLALLWGLARSRARVEIPPEDEPPVSALRTDPVTTGVPPEERSPLLELYRGGFGVALVVGAGLLFLSQNDALGGARDAAFTAIVAIFALALILAPFIWRLGRNLASERAERIRSQERAEVAAHIHDSVLQTLTLMQKRSGDPREVAALARRQERELRSWLAGDRESSSCGLASALSRAAEEVEDAHRVKIEVVSVGDRELDDDALAVAGAAREALVNAAKFAGEAGPISLYAEADEGRVEVYVRDRGPGFDPGAVPGDRRGISESIVGRMQRRGGEATISSDPGGGTEVVLTLQSQENGR